MKRQGGQTTAYGGRHQRSRLLTPQGSSSAALKSELAQYLLKQWSWGELSSTQVQVLADKAYQDQTMLLRSLGISEDRADDSIYRLAKLGSFGKHSGNVHRDLMAYLGAPSTPPAMIYELPIKSLRRGPGDLPGGEMDVEFPIFLPHSLFSWYYHNRRDRFTQLFLGGVQTSEQRRQFWRELLNRGDPRLDGHPMCKRKDRSEMQGNS